MELSSQYREVLRAHLEAKKRVNPRYSFRQFATLAGFKSPNYLQLILDGKRNLSIDTAHTLATRLKFPKGEREYFVALVRLENASSESELNAAERSKLVALKNILTKDIPAAQKEVFGRWFYLLVRELFFLPTANCDADWICERLGHCLTKTEALTALEYLTKTGFLRKTESGFEPTEPVLETNELQLQAALMRDFHAETLKVWSQNLAELSPREQELGVLNIPIHSDRLPELKRRIRQFQDEIIGWVQDEKQADRVVQLGTYLIPYPAEIKKP